MRREGSPWRGLNVVFFRELFDHLTSARMVVMELLVVLLGGVGCSSASHAAASVVQRVKALQADLLIVGFMGHSALYERIIGGTTHHRSAIR